MSQDTHSLCKLAHATLLAQGLSVRHLYFIEVLNLSCHLRVISVHDILRLIGTHVGLLSFLTLTPLP